MIRSPPLGLVKRDLARVQKIAPQRAGGSAVKFIAGNGVPDTRQMHADLVRAPGADFHFQQRESFKAF